MWFRAKVYAALMGVVSVLGLFAWAMGRRSGVEEAERRLEAQRRKDQRHVREVRDEVNKMGSAARRAELERWMR